MSYAIIGFGNIGQALAKAFARNGIEVSVATTATRKALHRLRPRSDPRSFPPSSKVVAQAFLQGLGQVRPMNRDRGPTQQMDASGLA